MPMHSRGDGEATAKGERQRKRCLVRGVTVVIDEIAAHPANLAQLLVLIPVERLECVGIDEGVVVVFHVVCGGRIGVQRRAKG